MKLKSVSGFTALILICSAVASYAQSEKVTLILQSGEEIPCRLERIAYGYVYFEAATSRLAFKYGDAIEIAKVAKIRLGDGRELTMNEFLAKPSESTPSSEETKEIPAPRPRPPEPAPRQINAPTPPSGPGIRLTSQLSDATQATGGVGLRLPDMPPPPQSTTELSYGELADLLAEAGLAGKLFNEINAGALRGRLLTKDQKALVDAVSQSPVWSARKRDLREAMRVAEGEFNMLTRSQTNLLAEVFNFRYASQAAAFVEFVQFLHAENALFFQNKWEKIESVFGEDAATALRDILNNYEDWHYLFGQEGEKR
ncbi:hypothetical protein L0337_25250 [candidate division KSB1 bacterium]|nr:hypothetical protein [candidate division KSB1 bacterium]